jgi:hypothetical protein
MSFRLAVSAEMVFTDLPLLDRVRRIDELGYEMEIWDWTKKDIAALVNTGAGASRSGGDELSTRAELTALLDSFAFSGRFDRDDAELASVLGYAALVLILAEGGLTTRWTTIRPAVAPAALLATVGTALSGIRKAKSEAKVKQRTEVLGKTWMRQH